MDKLIIIFLILFNFLLFSAKEVYKYEDKHLIMQNENLNDKTIQITIKGNKITFSGEAHYMFKKYIYVYSNIDDKILCKIYFNKDKDFVLVDSRNCVEDFNGKYIKLIEN